MKKTLFSIGVSCLLITLHLPSALAASIDAANWYVYNGQSSAHNFSVKFPENWKTIIYDDDLQGFTLIESTAEKKKSYLTIREFEGANYEQAIAFYKEDATLVEVKDKIFTSTADYLAKEAIYQNGNEVYAVTFVKRGSLIVAITNPNLEGETGPVPGEYNEIVKNIYSSFSFTDNWHQYLDLSNKYTFIFPKYLTLNTYDSSIELTDPKHTSAIIFSITHLLGTSLKNAPSEAEGYSENLEDSENTVFYEFDKAISATYYDDQANKSLAKIIVENDGNSYALLDTNIEDNFPRPNRYDDDVLEILLSFEFFNLNTDYKSYLFFPDVRDDHPNKNAINNLKQRKIIDGYPDGKFLPDGEINRAELTKMIVATVSTPDSKKYNNCFPDVKEEWFAPYVCYAKEKDWVEGYKDKTFKPEQKINRVEALKIIFEVMFDEIPGTLQPNQALPTDIADDAWYTKYYVFGADRDLLDRQHVVNDSYMPSKNITRKEVSETIFRSLELN